MDYTASKPRAPTGEWRLRVGAACTQTRVLAKGMAKGSAGEIEELGLAGARPPPPKAEAHCGAGTATHVP